MFEESKYYMSTVINNDEKSRLIKEFKERFNWNIQAEEVIRKLRYVKNPDMTADEIEMEMKDFEERIEENNYWCRIICYDLKKRYEYRILDSEYLCDICKSECVHIKKTVTK